MKSIAFSSTRPFGLYLVCLILLVGLTAVVLAEPHRVLPPEALPHDARLGDLTTLGDNNDDYFPFTPPQSKEAWQTHGMRPIFSWKKNMPPLKPLRPLCGYLIKKHLRF